MASEMQILGWKVEGLRCPDHTVNLEKQRNQPYSITLIQMPNGTGKTTTLKLLRAALSGAAETGAWSTQQVREFGKRSTEADRGFFEVRLSLNSRLVTIRMDFDFRDGSVRYLTTRGDGQVARFDPPADFRNFLSPGFVDFFVFDGELANTLLDRSTTNAETVIDRLFQVNLFNTMSKRVFDYWDKRADQAGATEERGYVRRRNRVDALRSRLRNLRKEQSQVQERLAQVETELKTQRSHYSTQIHSEEVRSRRLNEADEALFFAERSVHEQTTRVVELTADPQALSPAFERAMSHLKIGLDRVKLPESAAKEFFHELAQELECVCGRPITDEVRAEIHRRADAYLGSEDVALLNSVKTAIGDAIGDSPGSAHEELSSALELLAVRVQDEQVARNARDALQAEAEESDPEIQEARRRIRELEDLESDLQEKLLPYSSEDESLRDDSPGIPAIERRLAEGEDKLAEITETLELKEKRDILDRILAAAYELARGQIYGDVTQETNDRIQQLLPHNSIRVRGIDKCLVLEGQAGGSVGEQLSIAYAFLATLFDRSEHTLPFVVDSPAGPLDPDVRREIGRLVPRLGNQFVAFTIASERDAFLPSLKEYSTSDIRFLTLFRVGSRSVGDAEVADGSVESTLDGVLVTGEHYFNQFQDLGESNGF